MTKKQLFLQIFKKAQKKYSPSTKRLAGEGWQYEWQTLITTIYSAQSRDETTIPVMENTFKKLPTLNSWAKAPLSKIMSLTKRINFYKTKSKNSKAAAQMLVKDFKGKVPNNIEDLTTLPGVGRKTANLIITEIHDKDGVTIDTHCHRLLNILGIVNTKNPNKTEEEIKKIAPRKYWKKINRIFVLWGKQVPGRDREKLLKKLEEE